MAYTKAVSNEEIIAALIQNGTIKEAAAAAGITPRTIYDRMQDKEFKAEYIEAKSEIIRKAVFMINTKLAEAIETTAAIMADTEANPATRLQAAQTIFNSAAKFAERLNDEEARNRNEIEMLKYSS